MLSGFVEKLKTAFNRGKFDDSKLLQKLHDDIIESVCSDTAREALLKERASLASVQVDPHRYIGSYPLPENNQCKIAKLISARSRVYQMLLRRLNLSTVTIGNIVFIGQHVTHNNNMESPDYELIKFTEEIAVSDYCSGSLILSLKSTPQSSLAEVICAKANEIQSFSEYLRGFFYLKYPPVAVVDERTSSVVFKNYNGEEIGLLVFNEDGSRKSSAIYNV